MYQIQEVLKCYLNPNQSLRYLFCFSSRCKDLIRAYPWSKKSDQWLEKYCILRKNLSEARRWWQQCNSRKLCNFFHHWGLQAVFPALKLPRNCCIMNVASSTYHISTRKTIFTMWQNMKTRELQKFQFPNCLVNCKKVGSTV